MKSRFLFLLCVILAAVLSSAEVNHQPRGYYKDIPESKNPKSAATINTAYNANAQSSGVKQQAREDRPTTRGIGLSAWGIVGLILAAILLAATGYYAFIFYPFVCKKERNYDIIELTNV